MLNLVGVEEEIFRVVRTCSNLRDHQLKIPHVCVCVCVCLCVCIQVITHIFTHVHVMLLYMNFMVINHKPTAYNKYIWQKEK